MTKATLHVEGWEIPSHFKAFWMLVSMLGHFQLVDGAHGGDVAQRIQNSFGHNKDVAATVTVSHYRCPNTPSCHLLSLDVT